MKQTSFDNADPHRALAGPRVVDLRWLAPLPVADILREAQVSGRVVVVDETRRTGGVEQHVIAALVEHGYHGALTRVASTGTFIPLGDAALRVLVDENEILTAAIEICCGER